MAKKRKKMPIWFVAIWALNFIGVIAVVVYFLWGRSDAAPHTQFLLAPVEATRIPDQEAATLLSASTQELLPTALFLPTVTPNPRSTLVVGTTPTAPSIVFEIAKQRAMVVGYSVLGRPLEVYRFGQGERERFIAAGIHGGYEWNTTDLAYELIAHLDENPEIVPGDMTLYILPNLNPDGYERAHDINGRTNENNVDLNHNFPYHWKLEWDRDGCWNYLPTTGGTHPASEPETIALINFVKLHNFEALISYHSAALGIFAGGKPPFTPSEDLARTLSRASRRYQYPPYDTGCDYSGNLTDWASSTQGIPAVDIELANHRDTDFEINLRVLDAFLAWER